MNLVEAITYLVIGNIYLVSDMENVARINSKLRSINFVIGLVITILYLKYLFTLSPAIFEEVCFRFFIYAFCVYLLNGEVNSKINKFWCYFMMIIPHAIIHIPDVFINNGFVSGIFGTLLLSFIFGLPLTLLQRKKDLLSAMIAHGLFNLIPFCFTGFPY